MNYSRINVIAGWGTFAIALVVYLMTMAPTASYWDCGEFIACANELEVPHPPGAPFFILLGRIFAMFAFGSETSVAFMLNLMSVLAASFTILFTFWITTHLAKKLLVGLKGTPNSSQSLVIVGAGLVAGLANTFADSFWFNSVEAEVYALSSFFTAIVVWLMFKWENHADEPRNERWLILIAYLMGLSIGVHLLNLLAIPAIAFIFYFRKYDFSWKGFVITGAISVAILGIIQTGIIIYTFDMAWAFEKFLVGTQYANEAVKGGLGLPIGTGLVLFFILLSGSLIAGIWYSSKTKNLALNSALMAVAVIFVGFSSYLMIPIRSKADSPIDENNPENSQTFISYMKREQYGNRPLLRGPLYNAQPVGLEETGTEYVLEEGADRYTELGPKRQYRYADKDMKLFPRMYDAARPQSWSPDYPHTYSNYVNRTGDPKIPSDDKPTGGEDLTYFFKYQIGHMYLRYFMWNFVGREGDTQDDGWESGFNFGELSQMPDFIKDSPGKNHFYYLPFLFGLLGLFWQASKRGDDAAVIGLLFFFTGLAIVIYLNQYPNQPRERDYSFAGSFQTFAIWIGLGTVAVYDMLEKYLKKAAVYLAIGLTLIAPILMGAQGWDDHTRAGRYIAPESARNLLESCAPNAVLFTNGDNDTFPLWYLQEVEGVRSDVRVLCLSYVNTDWYIDQMKKDMNESPALPITLNRKDYVGQAKQSRSFGAKNTIPVELPANGQKLLSDGTIYAEDLPNVVSPMRWNVPTRGGQGRKYLELKDLLILNLLENVAKGGWERPIYFANTVTPSSFIGLNSFLRLEGLAYRILPVKETRANDPYDPFKGSMDLERMYTNMTQKFQYTNLDNEDVYYDENVMRMLSNYHNTFYRLSNGYLREATELEQVNGRLRPLAAEDAANADSLNAIITANVEKIDGYKAKAIEVMEFAEEKFPYTVAVPDPYLIVRAGLMFDRLGAKEKAAEYYDYAQNISIGTLQYFSDVDKPFRRAREYVFPIQLLQQQYTRNQQQDKLDALNTAMQNIDPRLLQVR